MNLRSHSSSVTSSFSPRISTIGMCVWPLMRPGRISFPRASISLDALIPEVLFVSEPIATISSPLTARKPFSITWRSASMVTIVAPVTSRSACGGFFAPSCPTMGHGQTQAQNKNRRATNRVISSRRGFMIPRRLFYRLEESNGLGKSWLMRMVSVLPLRFDMTTGTSPQNSQISWRQAPHGGVSVSVSVTTAMASNLRSPSLMALKMATRSAHRVSP